MRLGVTRGSGRFVRGRSRSSVASAVMAAVAVTAIAIASATASTTGAPTKPGPSDVMQLVYEVSSKGITADEQAVADVLGGAGRIVVVFADNAKDVDFPGAKPRAFTNASLALTSTPIIIATTRLITKPGTKRDLAHELGHVLLRSGGHVSYDCRWPYNG